MKKTFEKHVSDKGSPLECKSDKGSFPKDFYNSLKAK